MYVYSRDQTPPSTSSTPQLFRDREAAQQNERDQRVLSPENRRVPEHLPLPVNNDPVVPPLHPQYHYLPENLAEQWANLQPLIPVGQRRRRQALLLPLLLLLLLLLLLPLILLLLLLLLLLLPLILLLPLLLLLHRTMNVVYHEVFTGLNL